MNLVHTLRRTAVALAFVLASAPSDPATAANVVIRNVAIVDVTDGSLVTEAAVALEGDTITFAGPAEDFAFPADALVVDGGGGFMIPGLWDAHVHSVTARPWHFPLLVAHGVTSVRNMHTIEPDPLATVDAMADGGADFLRLYDDVPAEAFHALAERARERGLPFDGHVVAAVGPIESARAGQRTFEHAAGVHLGCAPRTDAVLASEEQAFSEADFPTSQFNFFAYMTTLADRRDVTLCRETIQAYLDEGSAACPTLINVRSMADAAEMAADEEAMSLLPTAVRERWTGMAQDDLTSAFSAAAAPLWETAQKNGRLMHSMGVPLIAGTDIGNPFLVPGHSTHAELELLVSVGLSPLEALQAATVNPARAFGIENCGQVAAGYEADLVILDENPLEAISNLHSIRAVVLDGRVFDRKELEAMKGQARSFEP